VGNIYTGIYTTTADLLEQNGSPDSFEPCGIIHLTSYRRIQADTLEEARIQAESYIPIINEEFDPRSNPTTLLDKIN